MPNTAKIRKLNDELRTTLSGHVYMSRGISARPDRYAIIERVRTFNEFTQAGDPYEEHDFGSFEIGDDAVIVFFKINYYGPTIHEGSPDPADSSVTTRVLTILLADEY